MKKPYKHQVTRLPKILTQQRDFAEIDKFVRQVESDAVDVAQGRIVSITIEGEMYCVLTALDGWCDCFAGIARAMKDTNYNDAPLRSMMAKLNADMPLTMKLVQEAKAVVEAQRKLYMLAPHGIINNVANTMLESAAA
jgi:hypothetical protein